MTDNTHALPIMGNYTVVTKRVHCSLKISQIVFGGVSLLKALAILPLLAAAPASAYTFVYQCELGMGGAIVTSDTPDRLSFEITYDFGAPIGWMDGTLGEIEITLNEIDDFIIVTSLEEISGSGAAHTVRIHSSGSAIYTMWKLNNGTPNAFMWQGECINMRPI